MKQDQSSQLSSDESMALEKYKTSQISLGKLSDLLGLPIEETIARLKDQDIPANLGVDSEDDLLRDIQNA